MQITKRVLSAIMSVMVAFTLLPSVAYATLVGDGYDSPIVLEPEAKTSSVSPTSMRDAKLAFNLKNGKSVLINMYARGTSGLKYYATMSNLRIKTLKSGKKRATFNVRWKLKEMSAAQSKGILKQFHSRLSADNVFGELYCFVSDYKTGLSLENPSNKFGVKVTSEVVKDVKTDTYRDSDGHWFRVIKDKIKKVSVTYPANYTRVCVGVGGSKYARGKTNKAGRLYVSDGSKYTFYQTSMYKKSKSDYHFMRVK